MLMSTDPGDLVLDPTCGSGTTAYVAEQWGRRWITIDTSRVALALARARIMGARYPYYLLADSKDGQFKEAEVSRSAPSTKPTYGNLRHGFVSERVPHITLKPIANNTEIDVIWDNYQTLLEPLREQLNQALGRQWQEWEIPRDASDANSAKWSAMAKKLHADWWQQRIARQREIDASIAAKAESEYLYDRPYEDRKRVRVAGPFTAESLSPHRVLGVDEDGELIDPDKAGQPGAGYGERDFVQIILENLRTSGVQQAHKEDRIAFTSLTPWPGDLVCAEGRYQEGDAEKRAAVFIGPEFGTVSRPDLVEAAREAGDSGFDVLIACAFNFEARTTDFNKLGRIPVLRARMNADLHMAEDLKNTGKGNLFVIFGEPDIEIIRDEDGRMRVKVHGVDVFDPSTGEVRSDSASGIACWFIDTDYNEESFFVRHAYFLGANDPYKALKTMLKAEIDEEAWATLNSDTSQITRLMASPYILYVEGESDERILRAWADQCGAQAAMDRICFKTMDGGGKTNMRERANAHFAAIKQIIPPVSKLMLFDYDSGDEAFHPEPDNPGLSEWKRKNIENYLLVPDAWKRAVLRLLEYGEDELFAQPALQVIDDFFSGENLTLPPGKSWRDVAANVFSVVDGKRILFENDNSLFQQIRSGSPSVMLTREQVAMSMTADEIHDDVHHFIAKVVAMAGLG